MEVRVDQDVLQHVATRITEAGDQLQGILSTARELNVEWALAGFGPMPIWAHDTAGDLRLRGAIVQLIESQRVNGFDTADVAWLALVAAGTPMAQVLAGAELATRLNPLAGTRWARLPNESLDDWITRIEGQAIDKVPFIYGQGAHISEALDWWSSRSLPGKLGPQGRECTQQMGVRHGMGQPRR